MNKAEKSDQFDVEALRKRVSAANADGGGKETPGEINAYARQIAEQFREGTRSPSMVIGQLRLFDFVSQFSIGLLPFLSV
ncbi:undecaprenyl-phosphate glucose phosphotransferase, partial [Rhizobium sp. SEMIA 4085]|nr:undecaprenyl-phosphate glucose phosphotransferase [Rhizobium sp. SEMIA 4085]